MAADVVDDHEAGSPPAGMSRGPSLSWPILISLVAGFTFLGGAVVYSIADRRTPPTAVDVGFYKDMTLHHDQAVEMALLELANGSDPTVRAFAQEIVILQQYEIGRMDQQLRSWGVARPADGDTAMGWMGDPTPVEAMPGLADDDEMEALARARGAEADALFLALMAEHHRAGAHMADYAAEHAEDPGVRALARRMAKNQPVEIAEFAQAARRLGLGLEIQPYERRSSEHDEHSS